MEIELVLPCSILGVLDAEQQPMLAFGQAGFTHLQPFWRHLGVLHHSLCDVYPQSSIQDPKGFRPYLAAWCRSETDVDGGWTVDRSGQVGPYQFDFRRFGGHATVGPINSGCCFRVAHFLWCDEFKCCGISPRDEARQSPDPAKASHGCTVIRTLRFSLANGRSGISNSVAPLPCACRRRGDTWT